MRSCTHASGFADASVAFGLQSTPFPAGFRCGRVVGALIVGFLGWMMSAPAHALTELTGIVRIAAGSSHTCALTAAGGVKCWGDNYYGQLGDNSTTDRLTPVDVSGLASGVIAISAGSFHTCALTAAGGVKCWGNNSPAQLGDNSTEQTA